MKGPRDMLKDRRQRRENEAYERTVARAQDEKPSRHVPVTTIRWEGGSTNEREENSMTMQTFERGGFHFDRNWLQCSDKMCGATYTPASDELVRLSVSFDDVRLDSFRDWITEEGKRFSGPPGMVVRGLLDDEMETPVDHLGIVVQMPLPDSNDPSRLFAVTRLGFSRSPIKQDLALFREDALRTAVELATHEVHEWLRFDGEHVQDPHPAPGSRSTELSSM